MSITYRNDIYKTTIALRAAAVRGVNETADSIQATAQATVRVDTSNLQQSIKVEPHTGNQLAVDVVVHGEDADYNFKQEYGPSPEETPFGFTPYMRPAAEAHRLDLASNIADAIKEVL